MKDSALFAISPIDGRYHSKVNDLSNYFSEFALIKYRVHVEIQYFIALGKLNEFPLQQLNEKQLTKLNDIVLNFSETDALRVKEIEKTTNHDVKAVEYFIKEKLQDSDLANELEYIHFGLTSQDINNTAIPLSLKEFHTDIFLPKITSFISKLSSLIEEWKDISMLAKTHGQPASPTNLGKEILVFEERLKIQLKQLNQIPFSAKFGGATGNFNAHHVSFPHINWVNFANDFVNNSLGLNRSQTTTQIEHYDNLAAYFDTLKRINTILIDLNRDFWTYISMDYFKQQLKAGEVGSSAMPHKVNPIDFENSEGNLGIANALFTHLSEKLPISRLQRDLTDSTVLRNIGVPLAHTILALDSTLKGLNKLLLNKDAIDLDLENNWAVVAEAIQTILRAEGVEKPYELLKDLTRKNEKVTQQSVHEFVNNLSVSDSIKQKLLTITPFNYTGIKLTI